MKVVPIPNGIFAENAYLVVDEQAGECAIVDPGEDAGLILERLEESGAKPVGIWLTHAHVDHVVGVGRVASATGADVWLHPADRPLYDAVADQAMWFGLAAPGPLPRPQHDFAHGQELAVGSLRFAVRHAPGHSPGSVCLVGAGIALSGDVLFAGSIGRTDLPGGDFDTLIASIERELLSLADDTIVYSGHGPETTIGRERRTNPFLSRSIRPA
jgi:glyoxylase-like metal-dependent hydrolase (beta-lactamase superfamily II)